MIIIAYDTNIGWQCEYILFSFGLPMPCHLVSKTDLFSVSSSSNANQQSISELLDTPTDRARELASLLFHNRLSLVLKNCIFTGVMASLPPNTARIFLIANSSNPICVSTVPPAL